MPASAAACAAPAVVEAVDLRPLNTFGLSARADHFVQIAQSAELAALMARPDWGSTRRLVLGGGSNLVLTGDFHGLVLKVAIGGRRLVGEDRDAWYVEAGAGENWHAFVRWTLEQGWPGLENLSLIPGTVGAAPIQNIGAYGLEVAERFQALTAISLDDGETRRFARADCRFGYRDSIFKQALRDRMLIVSVTFRLPKRWTPVTGYADLAQELAGGEATPPTPTQISDAVVAIRRRKLPDPAHLGNAGSFFKNPVVDARTLARLAAEHASVPHYPQADGRFKLAAGWLIEQCGWKGRRLGPVGTYERQALVLVNHGGATGADVARLAETIGRDVEARFGVKLEPEPVFA